MKLHQKGFLLVELSRRDAAWDHEVVARALAEYGLSGRHSVNSLRIALEELAAAGLIERIDERLDDGSHVEAGKVLFRYRLTDFGIQRMRDTGLLPA